jgi:hypothetical protein
MARTFRIRQTLVHLPESFVADPLAPSVPGRMSPELSQRRHADRHFGPDLGCRQHSCAGFAGKA